jgi:hypothetical protein
VGAQINKTSVSAEEKKLIWGRPDQDAAPAAPADAPEPPAPMTNAELAAHMAALQQQLSLLAAQLAAKPVGGDA